MRSTARQSRGDERGVSAVIGIVLLVGLVAIGSIGILVFAGAATDDTQQTTEQERVKAAFIELGNDIDSVASDRSTRETELDLPDDSDGAIRRPSSGNITIYRKQIGSNPQPVVAEDIGSIVYDDGDVHYAYQAGAVWEGTGNETQMVSSPDLTYATAAGGSDPTFNFPITLLEGDSRLASGSVRIESNSTVAPLNDVQRVDNQLIVVEIESDYYVGWGEYFEDRYENAVVSYDHANDTTIIELGKREIGGNWNYGLVANGDVEWSASNSDNLNSEVVAGGTFQDTSGGGSTQPNSCDADGDGVQDESGSTCVQNGATIGFAPLDGAIAARTESVRNDCGAPDIECYPSQGLHDIASGSTELQGGNTYYFGDDSVLSGSPDIEADLSTGNVTVILDGDLALRQTEIIAQNPDAAGTGPNCCYLRIYFNGTDMAMGQQSGISADNDNSTRVQLYGTSEFHFDGKNMQSGGGWHAALYAPGQAPTTTNDALSLAGGLTDVCSFDICFGQGSGTVDGAIVAGSTGFDQSVSFDYNPDLATVEPTLGYAGTIPPPVTYLHVSKNFVYVNQSTASP